MLKGLSPRVRGNHLVDHRLDGQHGSIPACTGKPADSPGTPCHPRVYPRVYGETEVEITSGDTYTGLSVAPHLSPRVRGNRRRCASATTPLGSIPACTGKPMRRRRTARVLGVYPRVYGETYRNDARHRTPEGLSPRVRGNRLCRTVTGMTSRSIPACTGKPYLGDTP